MNQNNHLAKLNANIQQILSDNKNNIKDLLIKK